MRKELQIHKGVDEGLRVVYADERVLEPHITKSHTINDIATEIANLHKYKDKVSQDFIDYVGELNTTIEKIFNVWNYYEYTPTKENQDLIKATLYAKEDGYGNAVSDSSYYSPTTTNEEKCYDFITTADGILLVVVRRGFLTIMTESKQEYKDFLLNILRHQYEFSKSLSGLNTQSYLSSYLNCQMNDNYFNLVKLMA